MQSSSSIHIICARVWIPAICDICNLYIRSRRSSSSSHLTLSPHLLCNGQCVFPRSLLKLIQTSFSSTQKHPKKTPHETSHRQRGTVVDWTFYLLWKLTTIIPHLREPHGNGVCSPVFLIRELFQLLRPDSNSIGM
jgi:hypothetical protein